jgi:YbgC/YbaW family acyl-CoA thioester hydrolase
MSDKAAIPKRQDFRFIHRLRVRWAEVDMQKIVFNGHYLMYFDTAVSDYWRSLLMPYPDALHSLGGDLYVKKAALTYHASAEYDDLLEVGMRCAKLGNSSLLFEGGIFRGGRCLVSGELLYVYADPQTQTSQPIPDELRIWLNGFEAGEEMASTQIEPWSKCEADVSALRHKVFHQEQEIDASILCDESDASALHAVVRNRMGQAVAAGRLLQKPEGWVIGRMAALRPLRGANLGSRVLVALEAQAWQQAAESIELAAMVIAQEFYARHGYSPSSEPFEMVGVQHVNMRKLARKS